MTARHASALDALLVDDAFDGEVRPDELMSWHTTYHIGGPARYFICADSMGALCKVIKACDAEGVLWVIAGRGSNLLVSDQGFPGAIVTLGRDFRAMSFYEQTNCLVVGAGVPLSSAVQEAYRRNMAGLEFVSGTPGSMGGALAMNAGTRTEWISQSVVSVVTMNPEGAMERKLAGDIDWGYRTSSFTPDEIILECELQLKPADPVYIRGKMEALLSKRRKTQPRGLASCGSVFRNPEGLSVGNMVEELGLKGASVGDAQISDVHGNFIVNNGEATAEEVRTLMNLVKTRVNEAYGIELQPEVRLLGFS